MKYKVLKRIRVIIGIIFLISLTALFIDFRDLIPEDFMKGATFLQFVPSFLKFITLFGVLGTGFFIVLLLTFLVGRVYCSFICPLGILQDVFNYISLRFKSKKKKRFHYKKPLNWVRYPILVITIISFLFGSIFLINWLDPYSTFGRFSTYFFKPLVVAINNGLSGVLKNFDIYSLYPVHPKGLTWQLYIFPSLLLGLILYFTIFRGRLYCNTVCPVGALLGFFSRYSIFRLGINEHTCINCGKCEFVCKSECIDFRAHHIDMTRCVGCFNCLSSCPTDAVNFEKNIPFRKPSLASPENGHGSNKTSHGSNQTAHGSNKTSHGSNQTAHGSNQTSHGSNQTAHESNQTAHGSNLTSHGNNQTAHGSKQTSNGSNQTAHGSNQTAQDNKQGTLNESKQPHARKNHAGSSEVDMNTGHQHIHDKVAGQVNLNKRRFIAGSLAYIAGMTGIAALASSDEKVNEEDLKPAQRDVPVSPPGSFSIDNFTSACTACTLCVSACPTHVLQPSFLEYGFLGIMQPRMDYIAGYCNFDCTKCSEVCPTGAISPIALKKKKTTQLGIAIFVKQNCVVETEGTDCGACAEHCPTKAVRMVPYHNNISIPEVTDDLCIGCGACEYACPLEPKYKAIYVNGNEVHQKAIEPEIEEVTEPQEPEEGTTEEFPF